MEEMRSRRPSGTLAVQVGRADDLLDCELSVYERHEDTFALACHFCIAVDELTFGLGQQMLMPEARVHHRKNMSELIVDVRDRAKLVAQDELPASTYVSLAGRVIGEIEQDLAFGYESHFYGRPPKCRAVRVSPAEDPRSPYFQHHHLVALALSDRLVRSLGDTLPDKRIVSLRVSCLMGLLGAYYEKTGAFWLRQDMAAFSPTWPQGLPMRAIEVVTRLSEEKLQQYEALTSN